MTEFKVMIPLQFLESTNARLVYQRGTPRLSDTARQEKREISNYLKDHFPYNALSELKGKYLSVTLFYFLKSSWNVRDLDNLEKLSIDGIFNYFQLNDKYIINKVSSKRRVNNSKYEYIYVKISELPESKLTFDLEDILKVQEGQ